MAETVKIILSGNLSVAKTPFIDDILNILNEINVSACAIRLSESLNSCKSVAEYFVEEERKFSSQKIKPEVLLIEHGLLYGRKFADEAEFCDIVKSYGLTENLIRSSYDAVFYFKAEESDDFLLSLWTGTAHLRIIDLDAGFEKALQHFKKELLAVLGIPEPLEIERKFLIEYPDLDFLHNLKNCRKIPITQTYFKTPSEGRFRIRRRGTAESAVYIKTVKRKISDIKRIEIENFISKSEYDSYMQMKEHITGTISKDRYCIAYGDSYFELDVFPFWTDRALLEIELLSEDESFKLPEFIKVIREVSFEPDFRNSALAKKYGKKVL